MSGQSAPPRQADPVVQASFLCKWYGDVIGLNNFHVSIGEGITGLVGPNGAGKSTLFKLITGTIKPNAGELLVLGQRPWGNVRNLASIGFCPDYEFLPLEMTGRGYLAFLGGLHSMEGKDLEESISRVSSIVRMEKSMDRRMAGYSKGMKQKLKIAGALLHNPKLLLLDEPLSGLDPVSRRDIMALIGKLHREYGHAVIVSSHVLHDIERMTHDIVLIYKGRAVAAGQISEIRSLISQHPHNILIEGRNMGALAKALMDRSYTVSVAFNGSRNSITARVSIPEEFFDGMPALVAETGASVERMYSLDDDLESVFRYMVGW